MTDILFPPGLCPRRVTWTLERAVATFESPLSYASQRVARAGARWRASVEMPPLDQAETGLLSAWLDQSSRADNCGIVPVFQNAGNAQTLTDSNFANLQLPWLMPGALGGWSGPQMLGGTPIISNRQLLVYSASGTSGANRAGFARNFAVTSGLPYLLTVDLPPQWTGGGYDVSDGAGVVLLNRRTPIPAPGRYRDVLTTTTGIMSVVLSPGDGTTAFTKSLFGDVSLNRINLAQNAVAAGLAQVSFYGARQTLPIDRTHQTGQFVNVLTSAGWELKRLVGDVEQIGATSIGGVSVAHQGRVMVEPALRGSIAVNAPTQHIQPTCRMRLAEPNSSATIDAPMFGGFAFDLVEWFGA